MLVRGFICSILILPLLWSSSAAAQRSTGPLERIAFGSCAEQSRPQPIWQEVVKARPDLFLFIGDNIYGDTEDMEVLRAKYQKLAAQPGYQQLLKTCPVLATWDDHDYGVNDGGASYARRKESQQVFLDFFGVAGDSPRRKREGVYHAEVIGPTGKRVQIILLDTRYHRSPLKKNPVRHRGVGPYVANNDPDTTILGEAQWKWLEEQLKQPAEVRLIASSIQVIAEDHGWEKWMNFPHERNRLYRLIRDTGAGGVIFLSGDRHLAELSLMDGGVGYPLYDLTSSGINQAAQSWRPQEVNRHRVATMNVGNNFGLITFEWDRPRPRIMLEIRDEEGDRTVLQKLLLSTLTPRKAGPHSPGEAARNVGKKFTLIMQVKATGQSRTGTLVFLNSEEDYRDLKNFTVVLDMKALGSALSKAGIEDPRKYYGGQRIRVTGTVSEYRGKPEIKVKDLGQIEVVRE
jgi:alkaline phosphatase D